MRTLHNHKVKDKRELVSYGTQISGFTKSTIFAMVPKSLRYSFICNDFCSCILPGNSQNQYL